MQKRSFNASPKTSVQTLRMLLPFNRLLHTSLFATIHSSDCAEETSKGPLLSIGRMYAASC